MHTAEQLQLVLKTAFDKECFDTEPSALYEPFNYLLGLGGKRIRPLLVLMSCDIFDGKVEEAVPAAMAVELFHNFTLMHDDIMDKAPLRRGMPTVHEKYNTNIAILSGDAMLVYAYRYLMKTDEKILKQVLQVFNDTAIKVCEGQQLDMNYETQDATIPQYLKMIEWKTAALLAGSLKMGAIIAHAGPKQVAAMDEFGRNMGIAFQLQDDLLDTFGDGNKVGKQVGGDIVQGKKTFLYLKALELADKRTRQQLRELYTQTASDTKNKVPAVITILKQLNIPQYAEELKLQYISAANNLLDSICLPPERTREITRLSHQLLHREK